MRRLAPLTLVLWLILAGAAQGRDFPEGFLWGPAISAFQTEAGGRPANADRGSDWWLWSRDPQNIAAGRVSGDRVERGPGHRRLFERDARLARRRLGANAFRLSIDWSRIFPRSTAAATTVVKRGGWLDRSTVREFGKFAAWAAWKYRHRVRLWVTVNEPMVVAVNGYVNVPGTFAGSFPPGVFSFTGAVRAVRNLAEANAVAYDAVHRHDPRAEVGPVHNMIAFTPSDPASALDRRGAGEPTSSASTTTSARE